jgi:Rrf2 family transcriptional regulator, iron-sulfur cluster assembly transcription factor
MSLLSKSCVYGLRAAVYVVAKQDGRPYVSIREIADDLGISFHFLTKILQQLTESGIMLSYRGPKGGVALAKPAAKVSLMQVIESLDGPGVLRSCILGLEGCGDRKPCALHKEWASRRGELRDLFARSSLADVGRHTLEDGLRLAD